jgi:hypothetical protein
MISLVDLEFCAHTTKSGDRVFWGQSVGIPSPSSLQKDSCHLFSSPPTIPFLSLSPAKPLIGSINIPLRGKKDSRERTWGVVVQIDQDPATPSNND